MSGYFPLTDSLRRRKTARHYWRYRSNCIYQGSKKCFFFEILACFAFFVTTVLRFVLLAHYWVSITNPLKYLTFYNSILTCSSFSKVASSWGQKLFEPPLARDKKAYEIFLSNITINKTKDKWNQEKISYIMYLNTQLQ